MKNFLWALKFLTIIPIGKKDGIKPERGSKVVFWFPVVGLCMGILLAIVYLFFYSFFPVIVADALIILVYIAITGALHLDGLADTCDGIWGGWNKGKRLEIMKDSRIGCYGAIGLICSIGIRYLCLYCISEGHVLNNALFVNFSKCGTCFVTPVLLTKCTVLILMPVAGRWAQVCAAGLSVYARNEQGTGSFVFDGTKPRHIIYASIIPIGLFWYFLNISGVINFTIILIFILFWIWYVKSKIGGMTGDTLGATNELAELIFLLSLLFK